ncbi:MAG TPA: alpha/beta fold hydrolase [Steroidobacteraceae bacterium]|nr:alpha/beta fold hydrolase [Steroidobacteraceae bacterium]
MRHSGHQRATRAAASILSLLAPLSLRAAEPVAAVGVAAERTTAVHDFRFASGESLAELKVHYRVLGAPHRDAEGQIDNAVLLLHSTASSGAQFLTANFAGELFGAGQPLDAARFFIIMPDAIGHGGSSKPSDGLRGAFPHYDYADMVEAQWRVLAEQGVRRLRLVLGTSMGCMLTFVWAEQHPQGVQAAMPIACLPTQTAGQNRVWRTAAVEAIRADPAWSGGNYTSPPAQGLHAAAGLMAVSGGIGPLAMARDYPTSAAADAFWHDRLKRALTETDANDLLYQLDASRNYDAEPALASLPMPVTWVNIGDDFINLPGSPIVAAAAARMPRGRFYLVPVSNETRGHSTHSIARFWKDELVALLARSQ